MKNILLQKASVARERTHFFLRKNNNQKAKRRKQEVFEKQQSDPGHFTLEG